MSKIATKYALMAAAVIILLAAVVYIVLKLKKSISTGIKLAENTSEANKEISTEKLTLTSSQYNTLASKLYAAMAGIGTDEEAVYDAFRSINTYSDLMQLMSVFGSKDGLTLREWLFDDLSASDINKVNEILASKSINYKF